MGISDWSSDVCSSDLYGIGSCPMEGFDARRVRHVLNIPERYGIPVIVTLGYPADGFVPWSRTRFDFDTVFHENSFGQAFANEKPPAAAKIGRASCRERGCQ